MNSTHKIFSVALIFCLIATASLSLFVSETFCQAPIPDKKNEGQFSLMGDAMAGKVALRWSVLQKWPEGLIGFHIKRRYKGKDAEWLMLNSSVIRPQISPDRDWSLVGVEGRERKRLREKIKSLIQKGRLEAISATDYLTQFIHKSESELLDLALNIQNSPDTALIHGFSYVDRKFDRAGEYEYGLFPVYADQAEDTPVSIFSCKISSTRIEWLQLVGAVHDGGVKLKWTIEDYWPEDVAGVMIMRHLSGKSPWKWEPVTQNPIYPQVNPDRKWTDIGLSAAEASRLKAKTASLIKEDVLRATSRETFLAHIYKATVSELQSVNVLSFDDYDYALILGFGCVDNRKFPQHEAWRYALFPVDQNGKTGTIPISEFVVKAYKTDDPQFQVPLRVEKGRIGTVVKWSCNREKFHQQALVGYNVYRSELKPNADPQYIKLNKTPLITVVKEDQDWLWHFIDEKADNSRKYIYAVAAVDHFQKEYRKTSIPYYAKPDAFDLFRLAGPVKIETVEQLEDHTVEIKWSFQADREKYIQGFIVERTTLPTQDIQAISGLLPPGTRSFSDTRKKEEGRVYVYRVSLKAGDRIIKSSADRSLYYINIVKLPPPKGLSAKYVGGHVEFAWKAFESGEKTLNSGFVVFSDVVKKGDMAREASVPLITENHYRFQMGARQGREYTFGVAGKSRYGRVGEISTVSCYVPMKELPRISRLQHLPLNQGKQIKLTWTYDDIAELDGFEIVYQNGNETTLAGNAGKDERQWTSDVLDPNTLYRFQVVAKSDSGARSEFNNKMEYFYIQKK